MLLLLLAIPVLGTGAVAWWAMQHRSTDGAFHAKFAPIELPHRILVVPDVDALLWRDAAYARAGDTSLRLTAALAPAQTAAPAGPSTEPSTPPSPADPAVFIGMAAPSDVASLLAGVPYTELTDVRVGRGALPTGTRQFEGTSGAPIAPELQKFWLRSGTSSLDWQPSDNRGSRVALVIIAPAAGAITLDAGLTVSWLNSTTWGLLILGPVLLLLGFAALAWPQRPREIVYVVDPAVAAQAGLAQPATPALPAWHQAAVVPPPPVVAAVVPMPIQQSRLDEPEPGSARASRQECSQLPWPPQDSPHETEEPREVLDLPMPVAGLRFTRQNK